MQGSATQSARTPLQISKSVLDAAFKVHSHFGPGMLESVYETSLTHELRNRGWIVDTQVAVPVYFESAKMDVGFRIDLLVANEVVVEIKSVDALAPVHHAQTLSYVKLSGKKLGLLINFNVAHLKDGIKRFVIGKDWH